MKPLILTLRFASLLLLVINFKPVRAQFVEQTAISLQGIKSGSVTWGDYNNDGYLDILLTGKKSTTENVSKIYLNNKIGNFIEQTSISLTTVYQSSVAWGDYNNDGYLDILLTGTSASNPVSKIYLNNKSGNFDEQTNIVLTPVSNGSVAWGDYDNDGDLDILLTGNSPYGYVSKVYRNDGNNVFVEQGDIIFPGVYQSSVAWGDYDNDGFLDILLTGNSNTGNISKLYHNNGDNTFSEQTNVHLPGVNNGSVAWGDYNNDGFLDILLTGTGISKIYRNNGDSTFSEQTGILLSGVTNSSAAWGDYDNDGNLDILLSGLDTSSVLISKIYHNNGNNTFSEVTSIVLTGIGLGSVAWGDYDNDNDLDILEAGNSISKIYKNNITTINHIPVAPNGLNAYAVEKDLRISWNPVKTDETPYKGLSYNLRVGKTAGGNEILSSMSSPDSTHRLAASGNAGSDTSFVLKEVLPGKYYYTVQAIDHSFKGGTFATEKFITIDSIQAGNLAAVAYDSTSLVVHWNRGNGQRCVVFCMNGTSPCALPIHNKTYVADNNFGFGSRIPNTSWYCIYNGRSDSVLLKGLSLTSIYTIHVIEYIGDPGNEKYYRILNADNIGTFGVSPFTEQSGAGFTFEGLGQSSAAWGDYDNDGFLDFIISGEKNASKDTITLYHNNGASPGFTAQTGSNFPFIAVHSCSIAWGDYDNNDTLDIIISGLIKDVPTTKIYRNCSAKSFIEQTAISLKGVFSGSVAWGDYDNDGDLDILITGKAGTSPNYYNYSGIYRNNYPDNSFTEQTSISLAGLAESSAAWGDYDNDGNLDILLAGTTSSGFVSKVYHNNGDGTFTEQTDISLTGVTTSSVAWGDYNNDGYLDILLTGHSSNGDISKIYKNNGPVATGFTEQTDISLTGVNNSSVAWGDYNNDGNLDILLAGYSLAGYTSKIYQNLGNNTFIEKPDILLPAIYQGVAKWGDYDNDGDLDLLLTGNGYSKIYRNNRNMRAGVNFPNRTPKAPNNPSSAILPNMVVLHWSPGHDLHLFSNLAEETPANTMSYNIRFKKDGTTAWCAAPQAADNGYRRVPDIGNRQLNLFSIFKMLPTGKYAWQVQAVDQGFKGGVWSIIDSFEVKTVQAFFRADTACLGVPTHFFDQSISPPSDTVSSWQWYFRDGHTSSDKYPVHTYNNNGTYKVKLVVANHKGIKDSTDRLVLVKPKPVAGFIAPAVCIGNATIITNTTDSTDVSISTTTGWHWYFGDGQTSSVKEPLSHTYTLPNSYGASLKVTANNGCFDSIRQAVITAPYPTVAISTNGSLVFCKGDSLELSTSSQVNCSYQWKLEGVDIQGDTSNILIITNNSGNYSVQVTNTLANCISNSDSIKAEVKDKPATPVIEETDNITTFCPGQILTLSVSQQSAQYSYQWQLNNTPIDDATTGTLSGKLKGGDYTVRASMGNCWAESEVYRLIQKPAPVKPEIYAMGPNVWILGCSNDTAKDYRWYYNNQLITGAKSHIYAANKKMGNYYVEISEGGECYRASDVISIPSGQIVTGIEKLSGDSLMVYPNPSNGLFRMVLGSNVKGNILIDVFDLNGVPVYKLNHPDRYSLILDLSHLHKGMYICKVQFNSGIKLIKLIIE